MVADGSALAAHALLALGERFRDAASVPTRPRDHVPSAKKLTDDGAVRTWMSRERLMVKAIVASGIQLLDLSAIRERHEKDWERIAHVIRRIIETTFDRKTSADDLYLEASLDTWMVLFGDEPDAAEADRRTARIAGEISAKLAGDGDDVQAIGLGSSLVRVHHITIELDRPAEQIQTIRDLLLSWQRSHESEVRRRRGWVDELQRFVTPWFEPEVLLRPAKRPFEGGLAAIRGFRIRLELDRELKPVSAIEAERVRSFLDREALRRARSAVPAAAGRSVSVPLAATVLESHERRGAIIDALRGEDGRFESEIERSLYLEIEDLPEDMQHARLLRAMQPFMPLVAGILVSVDPSEPRLDRFEGLGSKFHGVSIDARLLRSRDGLQGLRMVAAEVQRRPWLVRVHNVADEAVALALKRLPAVERVSGPAVGVALTAPLGSARSAVAGDQEGRR